MTKTSIPSQVDHTVVVADKKMYQVRRTLKRSWKKKNDSFSKKEDTLRTMRIIQKQGITELEGWTTQVLYPSSDIVDFTLLRRGANTVINPITEPLDSEEPSTRPPVSMEIDKIQSSSSVKNNQMGGAHQGMNDLTGHLNSQAP
ncbi:hypothetical protein RIF29_29120 [Crotalaria pallida]|uniref:Uncharacterized protein n=1 Tax=Crotalaria pallida TaxID=3830 RepID=A0AAN9I025_CROPI